MANALAIKKIEDHCEEVSLVLKSLSHPRRLLVLGHLAQGAKTVSELVELCHVSQSQMSHFLTRLSDEGLVRCEKSGRFRLYSIADLRLRKLLSLIQKEYCGG